MADGSSSKPSYIKTLVSYTQTLASCTQTSLTYNGASLCSMQTLQLYIRLSLSYIQSLLFNSLLSEIPMDKRLSHPAMLFGFVYLFCFPLVCYAGDKGRAQQQTARKPAVLETPFEFKHNQIILSVRMNGEGPYNIVSRYRR